MNRPEKFWNRIAKFHNKVAKSKDFKKTIEITKKYLKPNYTVLDFACATGLYSAELAKYVKTICGIDISSKMIDIAKSNAQVNTSFKKTNIFTIKEKYNIILAFNILHFIEEEKKVMEKIHHILKPGGLFISVTPCLGETNTLLGYIAIFLQKIKILPYIKKFNLKELIELIKINFKILETVKISSEQYLIIAEKRKDISE